MAHWDILPSIDKDLYVSGTEKEKGYSSTHDNWNTEE